MTKEHVVIGAKYLAEINALEKLGKLLQPFHYCEYCKTEKIREELSLLGTDFGKPNATPLQTELATANREMFRNIQTIINERIEVLKKEFDQIKID